MKPKDKIEICEKMSDNKKKIDDLNSKLKDDSLTTQGYYYILDMRTQLKRENESYLSVLEAGLNTDEFGSVYERTPTKKPFIERYLIPLLFTEGVLTIALMYIWRH